MEMMYRKELRAGRIPGLSASFRFRSVSLCVPYIKTDATNLVANENHITGLLITLLTLNVPRDMWVCCGQFVLCCTWIRHCRIAVTLFETIVILVCFSTSKNIPLGFPSSRWETVLPWRWRWQFNL